MKKSVITCMLLACLGFFNPLKAQNPTLSAGLESLTMKKGAIDVEALTQIIMEKQAELKQEALRRFILKLFPETNYTTKFYVQNCLNLLLNEKNPQVIEKGIYELTTNYALALGVAKYFSESLKGHEINDCYKKFLNQQDLQASKMLLKFKNEKQLEKTYDRRLNNLRDDISTLIEKVESVELSASTASKIQKYHFDTLRANLYYQLSEKENDRIKVGRKLIREKIRKNDLEPPQEEAETLPFGIWLDITTKALSENELLIRKGFFRKKMDYKTDEFYRRLATGSDTDKNLDIAIYKMVRYIDNEIKPYLENYRVIEAYYKTITDKKQNKNIREVLINNLQSSFIALAHQNITSIQTPLIATKFPAVAILLDTFKVQSNIVADIEYLNTTLPTLVLSKNELTKKTSKVKTQDSLLTAYLDSIGNGIYYDRVTRKLKISPSVLDSASIKEQLSSLTKNYEKIKTELESSAVPFQVSFNRIKNIIKNLDTISFEENDLLLKTKMDKFLASKTIAEKNEKAKKHIEKLIKDFSKGDDFYKALLTKIALDLTNENILPPKLELNPSNKEILLEYTTLIASTYKQVSELIDSDTIRVEDVSFFEEKVIPEFIRLGSALTIDNKLLNGQVTTFNSLSKLLKIQAILSIDSTFQYKTALKDVLKFVSDLGKLDKAESYNDMLSLFDKVNNLVLDNIQDPEFKKTYSIFSNAIKKYTLIDIEKQSVEIDVASFLVDLQQYYGKSNNSFVGLYLTLGLNQNFFVRDIHLPDESVGIKNIGFASEKLGIKIRFTRVKKLRGLENSVLSDVTLNTNAPFINEWYGILYGSGLLYSVANTSTNTKFDYPHVGFGTGIRFYNALDVNLIAGFPFIKKQHILKNVFFGLGLDIPLGEYLEKIGNKKK